MPYCPVGADDRFVDVTVRPQCACPHHAPTLVAIGGGGPDGRTAHLQWLPGMRERGAGTIVLISSVAGWGPAPAAGVAYSATKTALGPEGEHPRRCPGSHRIPALSARSPSAAAGEIGDLGIVKGAGTTLELLDILQPRAWKPQVLEPAGGDHHP